LKFIPVNRHIRISFEEQEKEESVLLMPDDYQKEEELYQIASVIGVSDDVRFIVVPGDKVLVDKKMIQEIKTNNFGTICLILDNYVIGVILKGA
jgi:hypothetical protein